MQVRKVEVGKIDNSKKYDTKINYENGNILR
jgi:hypothetical protein